MSRRRELKQAQQKYKSLQQDSKNDIPVKDVGVTESPETAAQDKGNTTNNRRHATRTSSVTHPHSSQQSTSEQKRLTKRNRNQRQKENRKKRRTAFAHGSRGESKSDVNSTSNIN